MKHLRKTMLMQGLVTCLLMLSCSREHYNVPGGKSLSNTEILKWNEVSYEAFGGVAYQNSLAASRINAIVHIAMHDAVNAVDARFASYAFKGKDTGADPVAAAVTAAHIVLLHEIPAKKGYLDSALVSSLATVAEGDAKGRGIKLGEDAGKAILAARAEDGSAGNPISPVEPSNIPGVYQAVPPFDFVFAPFWQDVKTFALQSKDQYRPGPHPVIGSSEYTKAFNEVKAKGRATSSTRTEDETAYAKFWYEFSEAGWNRVARTVATSQKLDLWETARLLALVDIAMADAYIAGWDAKFHYNFWRPYTAIRKAANDGNDNTSEDVQWESLMATPPVQDYPSTHSALGQAAATVLAEILGDKTAFKLSSPTAVPAGSTRIFTCFSQASKENADSRVMAGIHFRFACNEGLKMGDKIGKRVVKNCLKPLK